MVLSVELAGKFVFISSYWCPTPGWCAVEFAFGVKHVFVNNNVGCEFAANGGTACVYSIGKPIKFAGIVYLIPPFGKRGLFLCTAQRAYSIFIVMLLLATLVV